jgi:fatty acid synthase subunit alpha
MPNVYPNLLSSFINTTAGWINLLLLSSSGPVKIPVGAW